MLVVHEVLLRLVTVALELEVEVPTQMAPVLGAHLDPEADEVGPEDGVHRSGPITHEQTIDLYTL